MNSKIRCVIIDDEKHAVALIATYISTMPNLELVKTYGNPIQALSEISLEDRIDIIFMDVEMPHLSGMELAENIRSKTRTIIFTSAYEKYAIDAFDVQASHYLVKPIKQAKFTQIVMGVIDKELSKKEKHGKNIAFFKTGEKGKLTRVRKQDIIYFEGAKNYVNMVTLEKEQLVYLSLKDVEELFCDDLFYRVHRSHVINAKKVQKIVGNTINLGQGIQVQMGATFKEEFISFLKEKTLLSGRI